MVDLIAMPRSYLGGMLRRRGSEGNAGSDRTRQGSSDFLLRHGSGDYELFVRAQPGRYLTATHGELSALLRGYAVLNDGTPPHALLPTLLEHYQKNQDLPIERLEGSFTIVIIDGEANRLLVYRNIVGTGFTYYSHTPEGLLFGSNLAELVECLPGAPEPNVGVLPAYFLFRFVPGHETLFKNVFRLIPGELLCYDAGGLRLTQRATIGDLRGSLSDDGDPSVLVDRAMDRILSDCAAHRPRAVNLLSGGVDSSYIQMHWNSVRTRTNGPPATFTASLDHPNTRVDDEYALSAAEKLGTHHTLVPVAMPIASCLIETIAGTGEPPNHVQSCYFRLLARYLVARGIDAALCGEGADTLYGVGHTVTIQMARLARRVIPGRSLRELAASLAERVGHPRLPIFLRLADRLDHITAFDHPLNQYAVFTDLNAVTACFGTSGVAEGFALRRSLLNQHELSNDLRERVNLIGLMGDAVDCGSLWTTLFDLEGCEMLCPYLDSRMIGLMVSIRPDQRYPFRKPKEILKRALRRQGLPLIADRVKRGFGQPVLEWMAPGGQLRPLVERIGRYDFISPDLLAASLREPGWFLYSLLCYDLWHKLFIERIAPKSLTDSTIFRAESVDVL